MKRSVRLQKRASLLESPEMFNVAYYAQKRALAQGAIRVQRMANNHRGFNVAECCLGVSGIGYHTWYSACYMPVPEGGPRHCAEEWPFDAAREANARIIALALAAPYQPDDVTGIALGWTVPCGKTCQPWIIEELARPDGIVRPYTRLLLINTDADNAELELTIAELLVHREAAMKKGAT